MRRIIAALGLALTLAPLAHAAPLLMAYKGNGAVAAMVQPATLLGRTMDGAVDFADFTTPDNFSTDAAFTIASWKGKTANLVLSLPLAFNSGGSLADVAAGTLDAKFTRVAQLAGQAGFKRVYIRLGWEANGGWYPWAASGKTATYIAAFQHIVTVMRAEDPALKFVWCTAAGTQQVAPSAIYPGDAYVDVVGIDAYNQTYASGTATAGVAIEPARWAAVYGQAWGIKAVMAFAAIHDKPYAFPEWGTGKRSDGQGGGDDAYYIAEMAPLIAGAEFAGLWDYNAPDYQAELSGSTPTVNRPAAMIAAMAEFGSATAGATSSVAFEKTAGTILMAHATSFTPKALSVTAEGCSAVPVQNAPGHYEVILSSPVPATCDVTWGAAKAANLYDPAAGATAIKAFGAAAGAEAILKAGSPLIMAVQQ